MHAGGAADWLLVATLAWPHLLYAGLWFRPHFWSRWFGKRSVDTFSAVAGVGKGTQFAAALLWFATSRGQGLLIDPFRVGALQWLLFVLLVVCGQALNLGTYWAIGKTGVYYGNKFGKRVPWCTSFPFNIVAHPQYIGSIMTVWGVTALLWTQGPAGLGKVAAYWTSLYFISAFQEQFL